MADNYIERQQEQYEARKAAWKQAQKYGKKKSTTVHPAESASCTPMTSKSSPSKRRVFITGGAEGIGKAIVEAFCLSGDQVAFCDINEIAGQETAKATGSIFHKVDVSDKDVLESCMQRILSEWNDIDIIINNVGISQFSSITETSVEDFDKILSINLRPVFITSRLLAIHRKEQSSPNPYGRIINICSTRYLMSESGSEGYAASKGGIYSLTHALALSLSEWNITVNSIAPGWIQTHDYDQLRPEDHSQHPSRRVGKPEDFGVSDDESEPHKKEQTASSGQGYTRTTTARRLFRDPDNKLLGGVASGLAAYFDWDITLVRILMIVLLFVPYCPMIILYIIGWIIIPEARTAAEKLSMRGEAVTIENIGKTVTDGFERVADGVNNFVNSDKPRTFLQKVGDVFVTIAAIILKIFLVALVIICCPVLFVLAVVIVALVFAVIAALVGGGALLYEMLPAIDWTPIATISPVMTLLGTISGIALIAIPLGAFLYTIMRQLFHWSPMGTGLKWSLFILWVLGLVIVIINLSALGWQLPLYGLHCF